MPPVGLLFVLVEGDDDERFFERIIIELFEGRYSSVKLWQYAQEKADRVEALLRSIKAMGADYIFATDVNQEPCVTSKKERVVRKYKGLDRRNVIVVRKEIESWYLAGVSKADSATLKMPVLDRTDNIGKEVLDDLAAKRTASKIDLMVEILKRFSLDAACARNTSLQYFVTKYGLDIL